MSTTQCSLELGNERYIQACTLDNGERRVDIREWKSSENRQFPTKKGISLNLQLFKTLTLSIDLIDTALAKKEDLNYHIGANIFLTIKGDSPCVNIRKYWKPENEENLVPTKKGICLRPLEYLNLKLHLSSIEKAVPELETIEPCFLQDDHQNQLGMLRCAMCNPLEYQNW